MILNKETLKNFVSKDHLLPNDKLRSGIIHFGVGGFHRSHQAVYTEDAMLKSKDYNWGIIGVEVMPGSKLLSQVMKKQNGLYSLMTRPYQGKPKIRVISSIHKYYYKYNDMNKDHISLSFMNKDIKIISLTITEGGYNINPRTGQFDLDNELIKQDIKNFDLPKTIFGHLAKGLRFRKNINGNGVTILSCDNIQHNGDVTRKMFLTFLEHSDLDLKKWVEENCSFPNSMVDRITPQTSEEDKLVIKQLSGIEDLWPVTCEPFSQWVIEDKFVAGRPQWELVGAQFVSDVSPYEKMKLRLLNASHQALSYIGYLHGYRYVHEAALDPIINQFVRYYMKNEVENTLDPVPGIDLEEYQNSLLERFSNPNIRDTLSRNCEFTSDRIPVFNIPTMLEQISNDNAKILQASALIIASWAVYALGKDEQGNNINIIDNRKEELLKVAKEAIDEPKNFLKIQDLFGELGHNNDFIGNFTNYYNDIREKGSLKTISIFLNTLK